MGGFTAAWLTAEGIVIWRNTRLVKRMVPPSALAGVTLLYLALDMLASAVPRSRFPVTALAWGLNIAGLLNLNLPWNTIFGVNGSAAAGGPATTAGPQSGATGLANYQVTATGQEYGRGT